MDSVINEFLITNSIIHFLRSKTKPGQDGETYERFEYYIS